MVQLTLSNAGVWGADPGAIKNPYVTFLFSDCTTQHVPQPGVEPESPAVETQSLNHWTAKEVPPCITFVSPRT